MKKIIVLLKSAYRDFLHSCTREPGLTAKRCAEKLTHFGRKNGPGCRRSDDNVPMIGVL
jgi:hypothetical protein